jgi:hypothetical protein
MANNALDVDSPITESVAKAMVAAGKVAAIRYSKNVTVAEALLCKECNIQLVIVAEWQGNEYYNFTFNQGVTDATRAIAEAKAIGMPPGLGIYYCGDDFDATQAQIDEGITNYMKGANSIAVNSGYDVGVYGNGACCKTLLASGLAKKAFLWGAEDTNGTQEFDASGAWTIKQYPTTTEFGVSVDPDEAKGTPENYWGFITTLGSPVIDPVPVDPTPVKPTPSPANSTLNIQRLLVAIGYTLTPYGADGIYGPVTEAAIKDFQRKNNLTVSGVVDAATMAALNAAQ